MKTYPSISNTIKKGIFYAFDKLDGSNIRVEWSRKKGFYKFGTRRRLLDETDPILGSAKPLFLERYEDSLNKIARKQRWDRAVFFSEFFGPSSFCGAHVPDEQKEVLLIDVHVNKRGLLPPSDFLKTFGDILHAPLLYHGPVDEEFVRSVRESTLEGMTFEGVIVKGVPDKNGPGMYKIKSQAWLDALKNKCGDDEAAFERLK